MGQGTNVMCITPRINVPGLSHSARKFGKIDLGQFPERKNRLFWFSGLPIKKKEAGAPGFFTFSRVLSFNIPE